MFQPGQKVVCVNDDFPEWVRKLYAALPVKDSVYCIRGIAPGVALDLKTEDVAVYLVGVQNPNSGKAPFREMGFKPERFAPLQELPPVEEYERVGIGTTREQALERLKEEQNKLAESLWV